MERRVRKIEVGTHGRRVGFTLEYVDGERAHFLFDFRTAENLASTLVQTIEQMRYLERQIPQDAIAVDDAIDVRLTGGGDESGQG